MQVLTLALESVEECFNVWEGEERPMSRGCCTSGKVMFHGLVDE